MMAATGKQAGSISLPYRSHPIPAQLIERNREM
jgi:hypothetical protein